MNGLTVGDGFKFGCGFMLAALIAWIAMTIVATVVAMIFGTALGSLFSRIDLTSMLPQLMSIL